MRLEINGRSVPLGSLTDQMYSLDADDGFQYHFNVSEGMRLAERHSELHGFFPHEEGITVEAIRFAYFDMDEEYAMKTDLSRPLLFLILNGKSQLVDGWHRLFKAVVTGVECLPAYVLTAEEAERILWLKVPIEYGLDWGQHEARSIVL